MASGGLWQWRFPRGAARSVRTARPQRRALLLRVTSALAAGLACCAAARVLAHGRSLETLVAAGASADSVPASEALAAASADAQTGSSTAGPDDLLIVGAGFLGRIVARSWLAAHSGARVVGVTRTDACHAELRSQGIEAITAADLAAGAWREAAFANIVFSAPPRTRSSADPGAYAAAVREALSHWSPPAGDRAAGGAGAFVLTSSGGVIAEDAGGIVHEASPVSDSPRSRILLEAEDLVRKAGGVVLRLAGLYDTERGAHAYWLKAGTVTGNPEGIINQLHYADAAGAVIAALNQGRALRGELALVGDDEPMTRRAIVESALAAPAFNGYPAPAFDGGDGGYGGSGLGKRYDVRHAHDALRWSPRYPSFAHFMATTR
mmetsp:Transcript_97433/g.275583  ORF Transcript_97433/g.275583 Transcript_97433/m.275583 type:complete len:379 (+) Transcript_97433:56-1192(+)|eukprot:CAMPEP_0117575268 /NCGR_PEP_ID=MMETSP0784-20121206/62108_1 /TAXON_ID=39447 /ORGANISM="" /LENGTH=378 /DNA_ID=CAMNT_0005374311 /DNA_START=15 /DNA_END=1151 /DNA_ORIENTATION=-